MTKKRPAKRAKKRTTRTLIIAHPPRVLPPSAKVWDRSTTFTGAELDHFQDIMSAIWQGKVIGPGLRARALKAIDILNTKKI